MISRCKSCLLSTRCSSRRGPEMLINVTYRCTACIDGGVSSRHRIWHSRSDSTIPVHTLSHFDVRNATHYQWILFEICLQHSTSYKSRCDARQREVASASTRTLRDSNNFIVKHAHSYTSQTGVRHFTPLEDESECGTDLFDSGSAALQVYLLAWVSRYTQAKRWTERAPESLSNNSVLPSDSRPKRSKMAYADLACVGMRVSRYTQARTFPEYQIKWKTSLAEMKERTAYLIT